MKLRIKSTRPGGHRRAGHRFSPEGTLVDPHTLNAAAVNAIQSDPDLVIEPVVEKPEGSGKRDDDKPATPPASDPAGRKPEGDPEKPDEPKGGKTIAEAAVDAATKGAPAAKPSGKNAGKK